jgi:hypothetical protein
LATTSKPPTLLLNRLPLQLPQARRRILFQLPITELVYARLLYKILIGKKYELVIKDGAINATDLAKIKDEKGEVTRSYDPAYMNTVACVRLSIKPT